MIKAALTITTKVTKTVIQKDESLMPISGKPWSELKSTNPSYYNKQETFRNGVKYVSIETMPVRTWSIYTYDHDNNQLSLEDHTGFWYEKKYHKTIGLVYYKDSSGNFMKTDLNKEGNKVINYCDSKDRIMVHDSPSSMILYTPSTKTFMCKLDDRQERHLDELQEFISSYSCLKVKIPAMMSLKKFVNSRENAN